MDDRPKITRKAARQERILGELELAPSLRVAELARRLDVSTETIRRDLDELTGRGQLSRTYGGAIRPAPEEPSVSIRHSLHVEERQRIARATLPLIRDARTLMIGSGATTVHLARRIAIEMRNVLVVTHSFGVATVLSLNPSIRVIMAPGDYHATEGATIGAHTLEFLDGFRADVALLGASGLATDGPSDALVDAASVYAAMTRQATRSFVLADHSKFGQLYPARYARWSAIAGLVTDRTPPPALAEGLSRARVAVTLAGNAR